MTQKELLYMEDAINHQKTLAVISEIYANELEDEELSNFLKKIAKKHQELEKKLMKVMEDITNEG